MNRHPTYTSSNFEADNVADGMVRKMRLWKGNDTAIQHPMILNAASYLPLSKYREASDFHSSVKRLCQRRVAPTRRRPSLHGWVIGCEQSIMLQRALRRTNQAAVYKKVSSA